jgi:hypothetical protein
MLSEEAKKENINRDSHSVPPEENFERVTLKFDSQGSDVLGSKLDNNSSLNPRNAISNSKSKISEPM